MGLREDEEGGMMEDGKGGEEDWSVGIMVSPQL